MNDFLTSIVERGAGSLSDVRPRMPSMFEPIAFGNMGAVQFLPEHETPTVQPSAPPMTHPSVEVQPTISVPAPSHQASTPTIPKKPNTSVPETEVAASAKTSSEPRSRWETLDAKLRALNAGRNRNDEVLQEKIFERVLVDRSPPVESEPPSGNKTEGKTSQPEFVETRSPLLSQTILPLKTIQEQIRTQEFINVPISAAAHSEPAPERHETATSKVMIQTAVPAVAIQPTVPSTIPLQHRPVPSVSSPLPKSEKPTTHTVTVSIGRIELRGSDSVKQPTQTASPKPASPSRVMSLEQYIAMRSKGELS